MDKSKNEVWSFAAKLTGLAAEKAVLLKSEDEVLLKTINDCVRLNQEWDTHLQRSAEFVFWCALRAGYALEILKRKIAPTRNWVNFVKENFPQLSVATIYRYLELARSYPDPNKAPSGYGIMKALALAGSSKLKKQPLSKSSKDKPIPAAKVRKQMASMKQSIMRFEENDSLPNLEPAERASLETEITDLILILQKIRSTLKAGIEVKMPKRTASSLFPPPPGPPPPLG